jgi:hypothetical protein
MAFLDNSGDIILDVVLTDEGRKRLAEGDGSFKIAKFALGDDEINYALYQPGSSTATAALQIMQTPILEAFTNNMSSMKSKLMTYDRNDLFHLPIIKLNTLNPGEKLYQGSPAIYMIACDHNTQDNSATQTPATSVALDANGNIHEGFLWGADPTQGGKIRIDAGFDNTAEPASNTPIQDSTMHEKSYEIKIDHRLGAPVSVTGEVISLVDIDDDNVATYVITNSMATSSAWIKKNTNTAVSSATEAIVGARSSTLKFKIASSSSLRSSFYLFDLIGQSTKMTNPLYTTVGAIPSDNVKYIDSIVRVTGQVTGYSIDIPVRFVKNI